MMPRRKPLLATVSVMSLLAAAWPAGAAVDRAQMDAAFAKALPPIERVEAALEGAPEVLRARAALGMSKADSRRLAVGDHETTFTAAIADRRVRDDATYREYSFDISRAVRLPGKGALDRQAGALGEQAAVDSVDDARHQTGLLLAEAWFDWIEASALLTLDRDTEGSLERDVAALRRRVELNDAAPLDLEQAQSAFSAAAGRRAAAEGRLEAARLALVAGFPELMLPANSPSLPEPTDLNRPLSEWPGVVVERSHEIHIAEALARQAQTLAARARLDRLPDPTLGVRSYNERGGGEQGVGVYISTVIPIGGAKRSAVVAAEAARAAAAEAELMRVRREIDLVGRTDAAAVQSGVAVWRTSVDALQANEGAARRTRRGQELGEIDLAPVLLADRQLHDARRTEITARVQAWRALAKLRIDAHDIWGDEEHPD